MSHVDLIYRILSVIFPVFSIVLIGYFYSRRYKIDMATGNRINIDVFVPMLIFDIMSTGSFALGDYSNLAFAGLLVVLGSGLLAWPVAQVFGYRWKTFLPPMMFNNSGNMGLQLYCWLLANRRCPQQWYCLFWKISCILRLVSK